jgi:hypothetical protein
MRIGTNTSSSNSEFETAATPGSWTSSEFNQGPSSTTEFSFFPGTPLDAFTYGGDGVNLASTPTTSILDLYQLNPRTSGTAPAILIGKFSLNQAGVLAAHRSRVCKTDQNRIAPSGSPARPLYESILPPVGNLSALPPH